ncbi:response regulator [Aurantibacter sp.]|uniref:response regulator n=1 Tax=Aurantibacter sp. TaxID=2807103 RepID=UPI003262E98C
MMQLYKFRLLILSVLLISFSSSTAQNRIVLNKELDSLIAVATNGANTQNYFQSLKLAERVKKMALKSNEIYYLAQAEDIIAGAYTDLYEYSKAEYYQLESIKHSEILKDSNLLALGYSNLAHAYMLANNFEKSNQSIKVAQAIDAENTYNTRLYIYETKVMSLYKQGMYDSLVKTAHAGLNELDFRMKKNLSDPNFKSNEWIDLMNVRLQITFELYVAYGLMELKEDLDLANELLNKHKDKKLEDILYNSVRVYENYYKINEYKANYFLSLPIRQLDSIKFYEEKEEKYYYETIDYLNKISKIKTDYLTQAIESENKAEQLQLIAENRIKEDEFNGRLIYLLSFMVLLALAFIGYYMRANAAIKKVNASLDEANLNLKNLFLNRDQFLAVVSNEIRTPLFALEQLIETVPINDYEIEDELVLANYSLLNLRHSIDNSLQFSKLNYFNNNENELINRPVNLKDLLEDLKMNFRSLLIANLVELEIAYNGDNTIFNLEKSKLVLVLNNLLKNAIEKDEVTRVELKVIESPIGQIESLLSFCVKDNAQLIQKSEIEYVEKGNYIINDKNITKGIKLGLILSNQLLSLYNSKLKFSGNEHYNLVSFDMKLAASNKAKLVSKIDNSRKRNILYVDNNQFNLSTFNKIIGSLDYSCDTVCSNSALEKVTEKSYDLILIDVDEREVDCFRGTRELRNYNNALPIIAITSLSKDLVLNKCKEYRIKDVLAKPVDIKELSRALVKYA